MRVKVFSGRSDLHYFLQVLVRHAPQILFEEGCYREDTCELFLTESALEFLPYYFSAKEWPDVPCQDPLQPLWSLLPYSKTNKRPSAVYFLVENTDLKAFVLLCLHLGFDHLFTIDLEDRVFIQVPDASFYLTKRATSQMHVFAFESVQGRYCLYGHTHLVMQYLPKNSILHQSLVLSLPHEKFVPLLPQIQWELEAADQILTEAKSGVSIEIRLSLAPDASREFKKPVLWWYEGHEIENLKEWARYLSSFHRERFTIARIQKNPPQYLLRASKEMNLALPPQTELMFYAHPECDWLMLPMGQTMKPSLPVSEIRRALNRGQGKIVLAMSGRQGIAPMVFENYGFEMLDSLIEYVLEDEILLKQVTAVMLFQDPLLEMYDDTLQPQEGSETRDFAKTEPSLFQQEVGRETAAEDLKAKSKQAEAENIQEIRQRLERRQAQILEDPLHFNAELMLGCAEDFRRLKNYQQALLCLELGLHLNDFKSRETRYIVEHFFECRDLINKDADPQRRNSKLTKGDVLSEIFGFKRKIGIAELELLGFYILSQSELLAPVEAKWCTENMLDPLLEHAEQIPLLRLFSLLYALFRFCKLDDFHLLKLRDKIETRLMREGFHHAPGQLPEFVERSQQKPAVILQKIEVQAILQELQSLQQRSEKAFPIHLGLALLHCMLGENDLQKKQIQSIREISRDGVLDEILDCYQVLMQARFGPSPLLAKILDEKNKKLNPSQMYKLNFVLQNSLLWPDLSIKAAAKIGFEDTLSAHKLKIMRSYSPDRLLVEIASLRNELASQPPSSRENYRLITLYLSIFEIVRESDPGAQSTLIGILETEISRINAPSQRLQLWTKFICLHLDLGFKEPESVLKQIQSDLYDLADPEMDLLKEVLSDLNRLTPYHQTHKSFVESLDSLFLAFNDQSLASGQIFWQLLRLRNRFDLPHTEELLNRVVTIYFANPSEKENMKKFTLLRQCLLALPEFKLDFRIKVLEKLLSRASEIQDTFSTSSHLNVSFLIVVEAFVMLFHKHNADSQSLNLDWIQLLESRWQKAVHTTIQHMLKES